MQKSGIFPVSNIGETTHPCVALYDPVSAFQKERILNNRAILDRVEGQNDRSTNMCIFSDVHIMEDNGVLHNTLYP